MLWYHMIHSVIIVFMVSHIAKQLSHAAVTPWGGDVITATERSIPTAVLLYYIILSLGLFPRAFA